MDVYPKGTVTPLGVSQLKSGHDPLVSYTSPDEEFTFHLNGGLAPIVGVTEGVVLEEGMDGLAPPFQHLDHKGARQDGVTWSDTVYDPAEMTMKVTCTGNTPAGLRRVIRKWFSAWDPKNPGTLSWTTPEMGRWTCKPRWAKTPPEKLEQAPSTRKKQTFTWYLRNDSAFWQGPNSMSQLGVAFDSASDNFRRAGNGSLGPNWSQLYSGLGAGVCTADNGAARWSNVDPVQFFTGTRSAVIGPFKDYATTGDIQSITFIPANTPAFTVGTGAANYIWGRMGRLGDGTWDGNGVRAAVGWGFTRISVFNNFVETILVNQFSLIPPIRGERWTFNVGKGSDPYFYELVREDTLWPFTLDFVMCSAHDTGHIASTGVNYRGIGFGLQAGGSILLQATPAAVDSISVGTTLVDDFNRQTANGLGVNWPIRYSGSGGGYVRANGTALWEDLAKGRSVQNRWLGANEVQTVTLNGGPASLALTFKGTKSAGTSQTTTSISGSATASAVQSALVALPGIGSGNVSVTGPNGGPYAVQFTGALATTPMAEMSGTTTGGTNAYITVAQTTPGAYQYTATDDQVVSVTLGDMFAFPFPAAAYINVFGRWNGNDASPTAVCMQIGPQWVALFNIVAGVWTQVAFQILPVAPLWHETWTLTCGTNAGVNQYVCRRDGAPLFIWNDAAGITHHGSGYRSTGFGMVAGDGILVQDIPPSVTKFAMSDNSGLSVKGHLTFTNVGDVNAYPDYVVFGPGTFTFADGPDAEPSVTFGPLKDGQVAFLRTDPGVRGVYDISTDAAATTLGGYSAYVQELLSLTVNNNIQPLLEWFKSEFGVTPEQGNLYSLLNGRLTQPIPASPLAPKTCQVAVNITGATSATQVIGVITPQRKWPG